MKIFSFIFICLFFLSAFASKRRSNHVEYGTLQNILENSQILTCYRAVKEVLRLQSNPNSTSNSAFEPFYHYLLSLWDLNGIEVKTRTKWRTIFESLIIPTPGVVLKPNEKVPYYLKFLLGTGILPPDSPITLDVNHLDADVNEITQKFFGITFPFSREETCLKLIYVYYATSGIENFLNLVDQLNNLEETPNHSAPHHNELKSTDSANHLNNSSSDSQISAPLIDPLPSRPNSAIQKSQVTPPINIITFTPTAPTLIEFTEGAVVKSHSQASYEELTENGTEGRKEWTWVLCRFN